jgi:heat shock protein HslJ
MRRVNVLVFAAALAVAACDDNPLEPSDLTGSEWRLVSLQESGSNPVTVDDPSRYTLRFADDGQLGVKSDCNSCGGPYTVAGGTLSIGPLVCTKVFCGDTSLDQKYVAALDKAESVSADDDELRIRGDGNILRFTK